MECATGQAVSLFPQRLETGFRRDRQKSVSACWGSTPNPLNSPVTLPEPKKRRSYISTFRSCTHSKPTPLASVTMWKCRGWWSRPRRLALINLRHREKILPTKKAKALKQQKAIKHQGARPGEDDKDAGKRSTQVVGDRNGMNYRQVQWYIRLTEPVPDLKKMLEEKPVSYTHLAASYWGFVLMSIIWVFTGA